ncbi:MAG: lipoate--protein ligase family protein [Gemmatimonadales bacterium]
MITWHVIVERDGRPGGENMAADVALLEEAERSGRASLRLYRWDPPTLSFGRNEPVQDLYDLEEIARRRLATVRRPTGGRTVWHEHELTYAVAAPIETFGSLRRAYVDIHQRIATALQSLGVPATLAPHTGRPAPSLRSGQAVRPSGRPHACFATPAAGELLVRGRKVAGSAQVRRRTAFLHHGSILLDGSQEIVRAVSRQPSAVSGEITLATVLERTVPFGELAAAIVAAWPAPLVPSGPPAAGQSDQPTHLAALARP